MNIFDFNRRFPTKKSAIDFIIKIKYNGSYVCPFCGCTHNIYRDNSNNGRDLYCNNCKSHFSVLKGTIFENTHLDIRMWLYAINLVMVAKKGISACQLQRELGMVSYKGAWRMLHLIRECMGREEYKDTFEAIVEVDETYVGGKPRKENIHNERETNEKYNKRGRGSSSKTPVIGVKERSSGRVHCVVATKNADGMKLSGKQLLKVLNDACKEGTTVMTDQYSGYNIINEGREENTKNFIRIMVNHDVEFSKGDGKHTNGIESFWAIVKRGVYGIYHHVSVKHMQTYMDEFCFRMNHRKVEDGFESLVKLSLEHSIRCLKCA